MGLADRDYMRDPVEKIKPGRPRAQIRKADNKPPLLQRIKFWFWNLRNRK